MNRRVDAREWIQFQWDYLVALLGGAAKVTRLAYETVAFTRKRKIEKATDLLRLIFTWAVAERSLRETAALAAEVDLADVSNVALLGRFRRAEAWLGALLGELLAARNDAPRMAISIRLIDATSISCRGSKNTDRRVHLTMSLGENRTTGIELTTERGGESLERFTFRPGEIVIGDRGYATRKGLAHVARMGAYFIVRAKWGSIPLEDQAGNPIDLVATLRDLPEAVAGEFAVQFHGPEGQVIACRLAVVRKSEPAAEHERRKILADARRHGHPQIDARSLEAAGYIFVLTNAPVALSAESVLDLYRFRWQVEMKFKTLKSVLHLSDVPTRNGEMLNVYIFAKLIVALLIEDLIHNAESFSPWGYPIPANSLVATHSAVS